MTHDENGAPEGAPHDHTHGHDHAGARSSGHAAPHGGTHVHGRPDRAPLALPPNTGIMLCGHGSRNQNAALQFGEFAARVREALPGVPVEHGYLEFCNPVIHKGLDALRDRGVTDVLAVPGMLFAAGHAKNDIPSVLNAYAAEHPGMAIRYGRELGVDPKMIRAAGERIAEALDDRVPRERTLLVVVGRGASDPDANSNVAKITRTLWEGMGFGWAETVYSGVTFPLVEPGLERAARLGFERIVVFPYFLFTGVLVKRIRSQTEAVRQRHPEIEFVDAEYLGHHPFVVETMIERARETLEGRAVMNCQMCKYRAQVLGFEAEVGLPQASHHHHVEGVGGAPENCPCGGDCDGSCRREEFCKLHGLPWEPPHSHTHGHDHAHGHGHHHHHPYPHADHPLGPKSMERD